MTFKQKLTIICLGTCALLKAQDNSKADDFLRKEGQAQEANIAKPKHESVLSTSTNYFKILGEDAFAFAKLKEIIVQAEKIAQEYLDAPTSPNNKIVLQVISDTDEKYKEQFYVDIYASSIYLMFRWDENLEYDALCNLIMGGLLRKISLDKNKDSEAIPYFLELGLSTLLEQRTINSYMLDLARQARGKKLLGLKDSLNIKRGENAELNKLSAYWNLLALNKYYKNKKELKKLCTEFLINPSDLYNSASSIHTAGDFDKYFRCIVNAEISSRLGGVKTMEDSAEELLRLSFIRKDSRNLALGDKAIFEHRDDKEVMSAIKRRIVEIKLMLPYINPAYFNALLSLGEMFEAAANGGYDGFEKSRQDFISYFRSAKYIENRANELISN